MTEHDVLVRFRLRLFTLVDELGNVSEACRLMGVDRSVLPAQAQRSKNVGAPPSPAPSSKMTALTHDLDAYLHDYNFDRADTGRLTQGRVPADIVFGAPKTSTAR